MSQFHPTLNTQHPTLKRMLIVPLCLITFQACQTADEPERPERPDNVEILPEVIFSVVDDEPVHFHLDTRGIVEPLREFAIVPRVGGFIREHSIEDGMRVREGDVLLQFVDEEWQIGMSEAENRYLRARQDFELELRQRGGGAASSTARRTLTGESAPNSESASNRAETAADTLSRFDERLLMNQTGYMEARIALDRARLEMTYTSIRAPFSGTIHTDRLFSDGGFIGSGAEMGKLVDFSRIRVRFDVLESELMQIETGMRVRITGADGSETEGTVRSISPQVDRDRKTGQVIVEAANPGGRFKPGMSVDGRIFIESFEGRVRAPRASLLERDGRPLIFKLNGDQIEWIYVTPAAITSDWVVLNEPNISPGDTLAVDRHFAVSHLQRVRARLR